MTRPPLQPNSISDLSIGDVEIIKRCLNHKIPIHRIACLFDLNQGRISEINTGQRWPGVKPITDEQIRLGT